METAVHLARPTDRRTWAGALVGAFALTTLTAAAWTAPATSEEPEPPAEVSLSVKAPVRRVLQAYDGQISASELGLRLVANDAPLELELRRASYDESVRVFWQKADGSEVRFRDGLADDVGTLNNLITLDFKPVAGTPGLPFRRKIDGCLGETTERISPDAPARSPYPHQCFYNPFSVGGVQGIQKGYAATPIGYDAGVRIRPGHYIVTVSITDRWADLLKVPATQRKVTERLVVKKYVEDEGGAKRSTPRATDRDRQAPRRTGRAVTAADLPPGTPLPDLRALPASGFRISPSGNFLQFSATVWNGGTSPLVVDGFRQPGKDLMDGYQYFFDQDGEQLPDYVKVGTFEWDAKPTHLHWHFRSFAAYSLLPLGEEPHPGHSDEHGGVDSRKEAFCLANTDAVDLASPGAVWNVDNSDLGTACGDYDSLSIREVLSPGWGDTYAQFRAGQSFDLRKLANGCYRVWVEGNPVLDETSGARTLIESDTTNNVATRRICIGGRAGARTITRIQKIGIIDDSGYGQY